MARTHIEEEYRDRLAEDAEIQAALGHRLVRLRTLMKLKKDKKITFAWLAKITTLHHISLRRFEKGQCGMTVANLVRIKEALGCSWDDLLKDCHSLIVKERKRLFKH